MPAKIKLGRDMKYKTNVKMIQAKLYKLGLILPLIIAALIQTPLAYASHLDGQINQLKKRQSVFRVFTIRIRERGC